MLKFKGQIVEDSDNQLTAWFTRREQAAYAVVSAAIQFDFIQLADIKQQLDRLRHRSAGQSADSFADIMIDGVEWQSQVRLVKLPASEVLLCRDPRASTFAVIQRFQAESPYAKANENAEVLLRGDDASQLVRKYAAEARHTLRFMASNLVAKAQHVAWEQFPNDNPGKIVRAISRRCEQVVGNREAVRNAELLNQLPRQARGMRT